MKATTLARAMYAWADDHPREGKPYPSGATSTEVFQKLLDGGYVTDPAVFYIPFPGKTPGVAGKKLLPENVCWDVTAGASLVSPEGLPLVFMTGYGIEYRPDGAAVPLIKPYPQFGGMSWSWGWSQRRPGPGIFVAYTRNLVRFAGFDPTGGETSIAHFVPASFTPSTETYRQLIPGTDAQVKATWPAPLPSPAPSPGAPADDKPWVNMDGLTFVPAGSPGVLFSIIDVRVKDYRAFLDATGYDATAYDATLSGRPQPSTRSWSTPGFAQSDDDPVVCVNWSDAQAYCRWLTQREQSRGHLLRTQSYRLPLDAEWSLADGLVETVQGAPMLKFVKGRRDLWTWGTQFPPPENAGNLNYESLGREGHTTPVGSYPPNQYGLYDMAGNVWQWCQETEEKHAAMKGYLRGGSFEYGAYPLACFRDPLLAGWRRPDVGFRAVVVAVPN